MVAAFSNRVCEEKSVIKIFYDNDWGWRLISELSALVLYITGLSGYVKNRRDFPPVFLESDGLFRQPSLVHNAQFPINLPPVTDWHGPFFRGLKSGQIQGAMLYRLEIHSFGGSASGKRRSDSQWHWLLNDLSYFSGKLEDWENSISVLPPALHGIRILPAPFICDSL